MHCFQGKRINIFFITKINKKKVIFLTDIFFRYYDVFRVFS